MTLSTRGLTKRYGERTVLSEVNLTAAAGSVYGLVGPNGAGKTTLLAIVAGLRRASAGHVDLGVARRRVGVLPDTPQFDPWLTGREVVALAAQLTRVDEPDVDGALADAGLSEAAGRRVGGYSRGMLQRVGLAATLVGRPEL